MPSLTTADRTPRIGAGIDTLETPVLVTDVPTMERNIEKFVTFAKEQDIRLRSHVKTHKNAELAAMQNEATDGGGICCQTLGEVEVMAKNGIGDIFLSYQIVGETKLNRLVWLSEKLDEFTTTVDAIDHVDSLQAIAAQRDTIVDVIVEIDVGLHRTGVEPGTPAVDLARRVAERSNLSFRGLLAYEGHVKRNAESESELEQLCHESMELAAEARDHIEDAGIAVPEIKVGGTASSLYSGRHPAVTEINPGMYPFNDVGELRHRPFAVSKADCATTVRSTVISKPSADRVIVDAGSKSLSLDTPELPVPRHRDDIRYVNASEEHGWIDTSDCVEPIDIGDRIEFIVPHVCTTVNLHDRMIGVRDDRVVDIWDVQARGKVQ